VKRTSEPGPDHPFVEHWDDERTLGNGIIVTRQRGHFLYDDRGVIGFETLAAKPELTTVGLRLPCIAERHP